MPGKLNYAVAPELDDALPEVGECFFCKQEKEIVGTMKVSALKRDTDEELGSSGPQMVCEDCAAQAIEAMRAMAAKNGGRGTIELE